MDNIDTETRLSVYVIQQFVLNCWPWPAPHKSTLSDSIELYATSNELHKYTGQFLNL